LVEEINSRRPKGATPNTVRGPFYRTDAPRLPLGADICLDGKGRRLAVSGRVTDLDGRPVAGATIETWQANAEGFYENQQPDLQPEHNLRGVFTADNEGRFHYRTIRPAGYSVPDDGPVGQMLGRIGYTLRRPAHLHFLVKAEGFETISTHVYEGGDPYLAEDALFGVKPELVGEFVAPVKGSDIWSLDFNFVMVRARKSRRAA
jgi:protocatechuate 3,4-dioxygenase beta subunit